MINASFERKKKTVTPIKAVRDVSYGTEEMSSIQQDIDAASDHRDMMNGVNLATIFYHSITRDNPKDCSESGR